MPDINLPARRRIHPGILFVILFLVLLYVGLNVWIFFYGTKIFNFNPNLKKAATTVSVVKEQGGAHFEIPTPTPTRVPRIITPLPTGIQTWTFSGRKTGTRPAIQTATVDPLTPNTDATQTVSITMISDASMSATATVTTDTKKQTAPMKLTSGSATNGTWSVSWKLGDTYFYTYKIDFELTSATGNLISGLTFR